MRIQFHRLLAASVTLTALTLAISVQAAPLSYTNVDAGIITTETDGFSSDGKGLLLRGSVAVHPSFFAFAQVADIGYDNDIDGFSWGLGAGGHLPITSQLDLVGKLGYVRQDIDRPINDFTESGYLVAGAVRGFVVDRLEIEGGVQHVHYSKTGNDTAITGEGRYFFTPRIAGGVLVHLGDNTSLGINARFVF